MRLLHTYTYYILINHLPVVMYISQSHSPHPGLTLHTPSPSTLAHHLHSLTIPIPHPLHPQSNPSPSVFPPSNPPDTLRTSPLSVPHSPVAEIMQEVPLLSCSPPYFAGSMGSTSPQTPLSLSQEENGYDGDSEM